MSKHRGVPGAAQRQVPSGAAWPTSASTGGSVAVTPDESGSQSPTGNGWRGGARGASGNVPRRRRWWIRRGNTGQTGATDLRRDNEPESTDDVPGGVPPESNVELTLVPDVGHTGARFGSRARLRQHHDEPAEREAAERDPLAPTGPAPTAAPPTEPDATGRGFTDDRDGGDDGEALPMPGAAPTDGVEDGFLDEPSALVRPYMWTQGRTSSTHELRLDTMVSIKHDKAAEVVLSISHEHRWIIQRCITPQSVVELAGTLSLPLGVVRVLLGDLIEMDVVVVHNTRNDERPSIDLLERVLAGLRQL